MRSPLTTDDGRAPHRSERERRQKWRSDAFAKSSGDARYVRSPDIPDGRVNAHKWRIPALVVRTILGLLAGLRRVRLRA